VRDSRVRTYSAKASDIQREWWVVDAAGQTLGRMATRIATILRGKHKPMYTPHMDCGDHVIVINAGKIQVTGKRLDQKVYYRHSGYPGGLKSIRRASPCGISFRSIPRGLSNWRYVACCPRTVWGGR
jgi:ribosomal protein L13